MNARSHPSDAIPVRPIGSKRKTSRLFPFAYETDAGLIQTVLADYERAVALERRCLAWALTSGRRLCARQSRAFIDQLEHRRRNGRARLRQLATS